MRIVVLHGSARRGGDTDTLAEQFLRGAAEGGPHEVSHFVPIDMDIAHCRGGACLGCATGGGCVIEDDMRHVYPAWRDADVIVMAVPMFWGSMPSALKTLWDRLEAVCTPAFFANKEFVLLAGYRHYYGSIVEWLDRVARSFGSGSHAIVCRTYDPDTKRDVPIDRLPAYLDEAMRLGVKLCGERACREA